MAFCVLLGNRFCFICIVGINWSRLLVDLSVIHHWILFSPWPLLGHESALYFCALYFSPWDTLFIFLLCFRPHSICHLNYPCNNVTTSPDFQMLSRLYCS